MSPRSKAQNEAIRSKSIFLIKETALELFAHKGYHSTSISQIAKEAGVSKGLLYNYFSGKEELLEVLLLEAAEEIEVEITEIMETIADPFEQLKQLTGQSFLMIKNNLHHWRLVTSLAFQTDVLKDLESVLNAKKEVLIGQMVDLFRRLGMEDPVNEALYFAALVDGIILHYMMVGKDYPLEKMEALILTRYQNIK
ncbi:MAG: hypothetical protein DHS20C18_26230 [Saprospiraceae bacterium]|nr:MAG: hypothetical protein DHS20C18_26230 [Saprospiraceae bacterium]